MGTGKSPNKDRINFDNPEEMKARLRGLRRKVEVLEKEKRDLEQERFELQVDNGALEMEKREWEKEKQKRDDSRLLNKLAIQRIEIARQNTDEMQQVVDAVKLRNKDLEQQIATYTEQEDYFQRESKYWRANARAWQSMIMEIEDLKHKEVTWVTEKAELEARTSNAKVADNEADRVSVNAPVTT